ncbi:BTAD domain-containing putative transcriptional regulator [Amycolatopsis sp.]|uniref:BTAD domain-containing putative transcriptional regulator n=1 Tax=Amycolatopsis sp. TaxID=37632 RepID=UPI002C9A2E34|nr:BTAD domain-containing putative transcriptional regulator [Amycolatopsis sp.]HVV08853.1 BTAD domain-containing putative transcriptional regulator [Amycolatopsis sp.]
MWFGLLGETEVRAADGSPVAVGGPRPRALLALLLLDAGHVVSTDRLIDGLYGEQPPKEAANALQAQVSRLRRKLGGELIELTPAGYRLTVDPDSVDVHRFTRLARETDDAAVLGEALALWRGPALADIEAPFAEPQAARLEELRLTAIEDHADAVLAGGGAESLVPELQELAKAHPLRERVHSLLMRALNSSGRQAEALAAFEGIRRNLADELGADPSPELAEAHLAVLRAEPVRGAGVPAQLTSFVGRDDELDRVGELLRTSRLVTLTGPGGAGKTRLAIESAGRAGSEVCFVDLAAVRDGSELPQAVLGALGLRDTSLFGAPGQADPVRRIVSALTDRRILLVFDNCEQVIADAAQLVHRLLSACAGVQVLATSREPLTITGEALCPLPPLSAVPAVRLFTERAAAVAPHIDLDEETVRRICAALDGLPLAIELAAARLRTIPLAQLETRLEDRFRVLSRGSRTAAPRHQTLRAVVEWSWGLLSAEEQELARRLAVFTGGATVASAAAVSGLSEEDTEDVLTELVDKSLLETSGGRFRMLETIRVYSAERLDEAGERERFARAHAEYFLELGRVADGHLRRSEQLEWLARLSAEHANLHAALRWSVTAEPRLALQLIGALTTYWRLHGVLGEIIPLAGQLLEILGDEVPAGLEEEYALTVLSAGPSDVDEHLRRLETIMATLDLPVRQPYLLVAWALYGGPPSPDAPQTTIQERFAETEDPWFVALGHFSMSYLKLFNGDIDAAEPELNASLERFRSVGDRWGMAQVLDGMATLADYRGQREHAVALTDEAIELVGELGAIEELAELWYRRADRLRYDDPRAAAAGYERSAELARRAGVAATLALAHLGFGELARQRGETAEAKRWYEKALAECGPDWQSASARTKVLTAQARIAEAEGDLDRAGALHRESIDLTLGLQFHTYLVDALQAYAGLVLREGDGDRAARLLGLADALRGHSVADDPDVTRVRDQVGAHRRSYEEGRTMTFADAVTLVTDPTGSRRTRIRSRSAHRDLFPP